MLQDVDKIFETSSAVDYLRRRYEDCNQSVVGRPAFFFQLEPTFGVLDASDAHGGCSRSSPDAHRSRSKHSQGLGMNRTGRHAHIT